MTPADASNEVHPPRAPNRIPVDSGEDSPRVNGGLSTGPSSLFPDLEDAATPQAQHWLVDWHRYLDQVSRPVRRAGEPDAEPAWRPWRPDAPTEDEAPAEVLSAASIPMLDLGLGEKDAALASHRATADVEDPTLYDELRPIPQFEVPVFRAPVFELPRPRYFGQSAAVQPEPLPEAAAQEDAPAQPQTGALEQASDAFVAEAEDGYSALDGPVPALGAAANGPETEPATEFHPSTAFPREMAQRSPKYVEMLQQIRDPDVAQNSYKARFQESREELLQRLLDPLLTLEEASRLLGVCPTTVRRYTNKGALKHLRTQGNQRRFRLSDVLEFLESRSSEIAADARADREAGRQ